MQSELKTSVFNIFLWAVSLSGTEKENARIVVCHALPEGYLSQ